MPKTRAQRRAEAQADDSVSVGMSLEMKQLSQRMTELDAKFEMLKEREEEIARCEREVSRREAACRVERDYQCMGTREPSSKVVLPRPTPFDNKTSMAEFLDKQDSYLQRVTSDQEKIDIVLQLLGPAWPNYRAWQRQATCYTYDDLRKFLIRRYDPISRYPVSADRALTWGNVSKLLESN